METSVIVAIITSITTVACAIIATYQAITLRRMETKVDKPPIVIEPPTGGEQTKGSDTKPIIEASEKQIDEYASEPQNYKAIFDKAEDVIFFSGIGMSNTYIIRDILPKIDPRVEINLAVLNYKNPEIALILKQLFNYSDKDLEERNGWFYESLKFLFDSRKYKNVNIYMMNTFNTLGYVAVDYRNDAEHSYIETKHYFLRKEKHTHGVYYLNSKPGMGLYKEFQKQILSIEENEQRYTFEQFEQNFTPFNTLV